MELMLEGLLFAIVSFSSFVECYKGNIKKKFIEILLLGLTILSMYALKKHNVDRYINVFLGGVIIGVFLLAGEYLREK